MSEKIDYSKGVYDAKKLGTGRMFILGVQHMFAMFGATVLVPLLTGLSVSTTLLCAGLGTLLFHLITKKKVPAFLGSSFAYPVSYTHLDVYKRQWSSRLKSTVTFWSRLLPRTTKR